MAGPCSLVKPHAIASSTVIELSRNSRAGASSSVRYSARSCSVVSSRDELLPLAEGPSCIFVGPIETASKETLEALYCQARDSYYNVGALQGIWKNDLVALKGVCPNCGEEVFAFVRSEQSKLSRHRSECHVCESFIEFHTRVEQSISMAGRRWVHGRVYLIRRRGRRQKWT